MKKRIKDTKATVDLPAEPPATTITNCIFTVGSTFDPKAIEAVTAFANAMETEAEASRKRAKALLRWAEVFKFGTVEMSAPMISIGAKETLGVK